MMRDVLANKKPCRPFGGRVGKSLVGFLDWPLLPLGLIDDAAIANAHLDRTNNGHDETARRKFRQFASGLHRRGHFDPARRVAEKDAGVNTAMDQSHE